MKIYYLNGACGSGKTSSALEHLAKFGDKTIIAQPTKQLIRGSQQNYKRFDKGRLDIKEFHTDANPQKRIDQLFGARKEEKSVFDSLIDYTTENQDPCAVFITHKTLLDIPFIPNKAKYDLIIDETLNIAQHFPMNLYENFERFLRPILEVEGQHHNLYYKVKVKAGHKLELERRAWNKYGDDIDKQFQDLFRALVCEHHDVWVKKDKWDDFKFGKEFNVGQLDFHAIMRPTILDGWKTVRIMGANFTESLMYMIWQHLGVEWEEEKKIKVKIKSHDKTVGERARIYYWSERGWSKKNRDKVGVEALKDVVLEKGTELWGNNEWLWVANNDVEDLFEKQNKATRISNVSHGQNEYRHVNNIVFMSALNFRPAHIKFIELMFNVNPEELKQATGFEMAYQAIMRTSLRVNTAKDKVNIVVPDKALAHFLGDMLKGCKIHSFNTGHEEIFGDVVGKRGAPRKVLAKSSQERTTATRQKQKKLKETGEKLINKVLNPKLTFETDIQARTYLVNSFVDWEEVKTLFEEAHKVEYANKNDAMLASPSSYNEKLTKDYTTKTLDNIEYVTAMFLDIDDGELTPKHMAMLLNDTKHLIFNSHGNGKDNKLKYRVFIPFAKAVSKEYYTELWDIFAQRITEAGYFIGSLKDFETKLKFNPNLKFSGLDKSKRPASSWFYIPCVAGRDAKAKEKKYTFFIDSGWSNPLFDPWQHLDWVVNEKPEYVETEAPDNRSEEVKDLLNKLRRSPQVECIHTKEQERQKRIEKAKQQWRDAASGERNTAFFVLAAALARNGMTWMEIEQDLREEAWHSGMTKGDRMKQIPSIKKSLAKKGLLK